MKTGGIGASLSAVIHESLFNELDHEVRGGGAVGDAPG
jgi:pyruvate dehydrogenase E1 component beta subunit